MCGPRLEVAKSLADTYGEHLRIQALRDNGSMLMIFMTDDGSTYTITSLNPNLSTLCVLDSGTYWSEQKYEPPGRDG